MDLTKPLVTAGPLSLTPLTVLPPAGLQVNAGPLSLTPLTVLPPAGLQRMTEVFKITHEIYDPDVSLKDESESISGLMLTLCSFTALSVSSSVVATNPVHLQCLCVSSYKELQRVTHGD